MPKELEKLFRLPKTKKNEPMPCHFKVAKRVIEACERDLGRYLTKGECVDLLADNTQWTLEFIREVLKWNWRSM